jgi:hypothetical protein
VEFEGAYRALDEIPPNTTGAVRAVFEANENLFKLMFRGTPRLSAKEVTNRLQPAVDKRYQPNPTAQRAAIRQVRSFLEWVESAHNYRHAQGVEEPTPLPLPLALVLISNGVGFLRWLAEMDAETRAAEK